MSRSCSSSGSEWRSFSVRLQVLKRQSRFILRRKEIIFTSASVCRLFPPAARSLPAHFPLTVPGQSCLCGSCRKAFPDFPRFEAFRLKPRPEHLGSDPVLLLLLSVPTIKTEPHDDYGAALLCSQHALLHPKAYYGAQVAPPVTSDPRPCVVGGAYGRSPTSSPKLPDLSPFSRPPPAHASIIQEAPRRLPSPADSPTSTPLPQTPARPAGSPQAPEPAGRVREGGVSIKEEPQELDQMYLDDGERKLVFSGVRGQRF